MANKKKTEEGEINMPAEQAAIESHIEALQILSTTDSGNNPMVVLARHALLLINYHVSEGEMRQQVAAKYIEQIIGCLKD